MRVQTLSYQDDVGTICADVVMVRDQARRMTEMIREKTLHTHPDKSGIIALGSKAFK